MENGKQSDISIATPQHPLARDAAAAAAAAAIAMLARLQPLFYLCTFPPALSPALAVPRVGKEGVCAGASLYYSVNDDLWRDASRHVTVTANRDIVIRRGPMPNTNRLSRRYGDTGIPRARIFVTAQ